jgi:hypothetical protein
LRTAITCILSAVLTLAAPAAFAGKSGRVLERCRADIEALCKSAGKKKRAIRACLREHAPRLSPACGEALARKKKARPPT